MVDLIERLEVLLKLECVAEDYLSASYQQQLAQESEATETNSVSSSSAATSGINEVWREKICEWSYQVIDHFNFSREVVSISIHFLDRFLSTRVVNKKTFQVAAMTTLYLAVKLYEPGMISMNAMLGLSRGYFTVKQMEDMEVAILRALSWKMHPPTSYCFVKHLLFLLPHTSVSMETRHSILELARFLTELSIIDYFFVVYRPSAVALAALLNSLEAIQGNSRAPIIDFEAELKQIPGLDPCRQDVLDCRERLQMLYEQGGYASPDVIPQDYEIRDDSISPVSVTRVVVQESNPRVALKDECYGITIR